MKQQDGSSEQSKIKDRSVSLKTLSFYHHSNITLCITLLLHQYCVKSIFPRRVPGLEVTDLEMSDLEITDLEVPDLEMADLEVPALQEPSLEVSGLEVPGLEVPGLEVLV